MPLEGDTPVSTRDDLVAALVEHACCFSEDDAAKLVDAFAHELAERQRASGVDDYCWGTRCECGPHGGVADLIDPLKDSP